MCHSLPLFSYARDGSIMFEWFRKGHNLKYAKPGRVLPDPTLFPNYFQNAQFMWCRFAEWWPHSREDAKKVVFIVSGLGEHSGRYDSVALRLTQAGYAVFSMDNQGAGGSEGVRTYVEFFDDFVKDVLQFIDFILNERYAEELKGPKAAKQIFLIGHSMGGLISSLVSEERPDQFAAVILSGPALQFYSPLGCCLQKLLSCLDCMLPKMPVASLPSGCNSSNPIINQFAREDPYCANVAVRAHFVKEFMQAQEVSFAATDRVTFPLLIVHGGADRLCALEGSERFIEAVPSQDKQLKVYPDAGHEVLTDFCRQEVLDDVIHFIETHSSRPPTSLDGAGSTAEPIDKPPPSLMSAASPRSQSGIHPSSDVVHFVGVNEDSKASL